MSEPADKDLYKYVVKLADKKFESKSGIYRSSWIVREYKKRGGKYIGNKPKNSGLKRWYKEKWVDLNRPIKDKSGKIIDYEKCGRTDTISLSKYPVCRPSKRINKKTPKTYTELNKKSISKAKKEKSKVKGSKNIQFGGNYENDNDSTPLQLNDEIELFNGSVFRVVKSLGEGAFKTALLAEEVSKPENKVVIFEQFVDLNSDNLERQLYLIANFKKEIKILKEILKQNNGVCPENIICPIFTQEPKLKNGKIRHGYIITNYFSGEDLFTFLFEGEKKNLDNSYLDNFQDINPRSIKLIKTIAEVFSKLHNELKFAHLDIKPENIMIDKGDNVSIIDIGHSCNVTNIDCYPGGTESYIAPEIYKINEKITDFELVKKADIWSLGCVFYDIIFQQDKTIGDLIDYKNPSTIDNTVKSILKKINTYQKPILNDLLESVLIPMLKQENTQRPTITEVVSKLDTLYKKMLSDVTDNTVTLEKQSDVMDLSELIKKIDNLSVLTGTFEEFDQTGGKKQFYGKKSSVNVRIPKNVKKWAQYAFYLKKSGFQGALETGWKRAKQLANNDFIPIEDLRYMRNWYARHIYTSYPGFKQWIDAGKPMDESWHNKRAIQSWVTWGGNPGFKWINSDKVINLLNNHFDKNYQKIKSKDF
jgi:serine/threonine protein kinase